MGQAKQRGTYEQRKAAAIERNRLGQEQLSKAQVIELKPEAGTRLEQAARRRMGRSGSLTILALSTALFGR